MRGKHLESEDGSPRKAEQINQLQKETGVVILLSGKGREGSKGGDERKTRQIIPSSS